MDKHSHTLDRREKSRLIGVRAPVRCRAPIFSVRTPCGSRRACALPFLDYPSFECRTKASCRFWDRSRSEEHTSELQSHLNLVCRLLLEKKKKITEVI